ncbi:MAG: HAD-IIB family hydrolase [Clostridia bacterium]|nr:HAD-IIB family hydrolase [Clostridia bacterium]
MRKLLASDLDGTIYRNRKTLPEDIEAITEWQRQGNIFCLCSGRAPLSGIQEMQKCGLHPDLLITGNGAAALDMEGKFLYRKLLPKGVHRRIFALAHEYRVTAVNGQSPEGELFQYSYIDPSRVNISIEDLLAMEEFLQFNAVFKESPEDARAFSDRVDREIDGAAAQRNGVYIDCSAEGVDKGAGVAAAAAHFDIPAEQCYTIGDNNNDLSMLLPYHGAVISDGNPETIEKVGHAVPNIAAFIEEILKD